jgi:hypothetical protein
MTERQYQRELVLRIKNRWPDCFVMRNDVLHNQGVPDILILFNNTWAMLEVKMADNSRRQPNQEHYVDRFSHMSFAAFINPSNEEAVLNDLQSTLGLPREARIS